MSTAALSSLELSQMGLDNIGLMADVAEIHTRTATYDVTGEEVATWTFSATTPCGFGFSPFKFRSRELSVYGAEETSEILVRARVPLAEKGNFSTDDRFILVYRYGTALDVPEVYDIQGFDEHGPSGLVVNLKRVEL